MNDGHRYKIVDYLIIHHSAGGEYVNSSDVIVQNAFSRVGKSRAYKNIEHSYHEHPSRPGIETFSQAHFALHKYTKDDA